MDAVGDHPEQQMLAYIYGKFMSVLAQTRFLASVAYLLSSTVALRR